MDASLDKIETMKDMLGNEIKIGDTVAVTVPYYSELKICTVEKINPKSIGTDKHGTRLMHQFVKVHNET